MGWACRFQKPDTKRIGRLHQSARPGRAFTSTPYRRPLPPAAVVPVIPHRLDPLPPLCVPIWPPPRVLIGSDATNQRPPSPDSPSIPLTSAMSSATRPTNHSPARVNR